MNDFCIHETSLLFYMKERLKQKIKQKGGFRYNNRDLSTISRGKQKKKLAKDRITTLLLLLLLPSFYYTEDMNKNYQVVFVKPKKVILKQIKILVAKKGQVLIKTLVTQISTGTNLPF